MTSKSLNRNVPTLDGRSEYGRHHVLPSQAEAESKRMGFQGETLQRFTASNFYLLVVVVGDTQVGIIGTPPDVPATNLEYDRQTRADHPTFDHKTVFQQDVFHPVTQPSPQLFSSAQAESTEHPQAEPKD